jgi:hypothetical protein
MLYHPQINSVQDKWMVKQSKFCKGDNKEDYLRIGKFKNF